MLLTAVVISHAHDWFNPIHQVAIKELHTGASSDLEIEFAQEACVQNQFYNPNLVRMLFVTGGEKHQHFSLEVRLG